jgi:ubiquinone/menaquinone biosynthesis C-methylase UbiE
MSILSTLSYISRTRKLELFHKVIKPTQQMKVLDVGAEINPDGKNELQFIESYPWKNNISAVNLCTEDIALIKKHYPEIDAKIGDACSLPWPDKYFEVIYSNAVIEHVGSIEKQKKMASEIMRVGKRWFVTTPNRWYPFEFHMRLPLVTWLPYHGYRWFGRIVSYNDVKKRYMSGINHDDLRLLSAAELKQWFPGSRIVKQRVTFMAETLIVIGGDL